MITLTLHLGNDVYGDGIRPLYVDHNRIEAVCEVTFRYFGRGSKTEYTYTQLTTMSGAMFHVMETPDEVLRIAEAKDLRR
jgi:hypothetical protein